MVQPILMYGCEIWGSSIKDRKDILEEPWERFHTRVCKNILGVHKGTTNIATLAEIGRYPVTHDIHKQMVKYLIRFESLPENRLSKQSFQEQSKDPMGTTWLSKTKYFLDSLDLSHIHINQSSEGWKKSEIDKFSKTIKKRKMIILNKILKEHWTLKRN